MISERLDKEGIMFELLATEKAQDPFHFAQTIDLDKYCLLIGAGGDGTVHEVVNGMLMRSDKKRVPIAILPNGSGDCFCMGLGIMNMEQALNYICKGETIMVDVHRVLLDHENEESLPEGKERLEHCRYMINASGCAMPPLLAQKAKPYKQSFGKLSYKIATLVETCKGNLVNDNYEVFIDGVSVGSPQQEHSTICLMAFNGKYCGGGMMHPYSCMNDGMTDIMWAADPTVNSLSGIVSVMRKNKEGLQVYDHQWTYFRGKQLIVRFKGKQMRRPPTEFGA